MFVLLWSGGKRSGEPDENACGLQIEVHVPELVSGLEMVTFESMIVEELTEVTVKLKRVRSDVAVL